MTLDDIILAVKTAYQTNTALQIKGAGTKQFYGTTSTTSTGQLLDVSSYTGIVAYEPTELYITAKCGTTLKEIEATLAQHNQMLAFEPPHFSHKIEDDAEGAAQTNIGATVGGCVAAGLSGPRRMQAGAVRDFVLGATIVDGTGQVLSFGGQVMKNVAGYDVSRLLAGSLGTLGVICEVTLKVLPKPMCEQTICFNLPQTEAIHKLNDWCAQPIPISASFWMDDVLTLRLSGANEAVASALQKLGGTLVPDAEATAFWLSIREQTHPAFSDTVLWRVAVPSTTAALPIQNLRAIEWGGALRWYASHEDAARIRFIANQAGGHAVLYHAPEELREHTGVFNPLTPPLLAVHQRLKRSFDPHGILNIGRLYKGL